MAEVNSNDGGTKLAPIYAVAITSVILAAACGAITIGMAIAFLTGRAVAFPGALGLVLGATDSLVAPIAIGLFGAVAGLVALLAFGKIKKSPDTADLVKSGAFRAITAVGAIISSFVGEDSLISVKGKIHIKEDDVKILAELITPFPQDKDILFN